MNQANLPEVYQPSSYLFYDISPGNPIPALSRLVYRGPGAYLSPMSPCAALCFKDAERFPRGEPCGGQARRAAPVARRQWGRCCAPLGLGASRVLGCPVSGGGDFAPGWGSPIITLPFAHLPSRSRLGAVYSAAPAGDPFCRKESPSPRVRRGPASEPDASPGQAAPEGPAGSRGCAAQAQASLPQGCGGAAAGGDPGGGTTEPEKAERRSWGLHLRQQPCRSREAIPGDASHRVPLVEEGREALHVPPGQWSPTSAQPAQDQHTGGASGGRAAVWTHIHGLRFYKCL